MKTKMSWKLRLAVMDFKPKRGKFYIDLASTLKASKGASLHEIISKIAVRYKGESLGYLCEHWLEAFKHHGRFADCIRGTIPDQDITMIAASEDGGTLEEGLMTLGEGVDGLQKTEKEAFKILIAGFFMFFLLHVFTGIFSFFVMPSLEKAMKGAADINKLGLAGDVFFGGAEIVRGYWWLWIGSLIGLVFLLRWALPNYVGKHRRFLDNHILPFQMYRDFNGATFLVSLGGLSKLVGSQLTQLYPSLTAMKNRSTVAWLNWQIDMIQHNIQVAPNSKAEIFNTGICGKALYYRMLDVADYQDTSAMLSQVGRICLEIAPEEVKSKANKIRYVLMVGSICLMVGMYLGTTILVNLFKTVAQEQASGF